jgi:predicted GNAT family acetyltransferase
MPVEAAQALAREVATHDDNVPWVVGSELIVAAFLRAYRSSRTLGSSRKVRRGRCDVIYEAGEMARPNVEGLSRMATMEDFDVAYQWNLDFMEFIDGVAPSSDERDREALRARLTAGALWFWCVEQTPVSMAGHASRVQTPGDVITRVGPVYTPAGLRHRGYGAAITASLTDSLQRAGSRVMLYADAANPTSNGVYRRIGYHIVDQVTRYEFGSDHTA